MCSGYFEDEAGTREAIDADGWFHTGDLARVDAEGFFTIAGRKKDMFISGGENVYPLELESVLYEHPAVQQCAVVGVPDAKWGEAGRAFVVVKADAQATADALLEHLRGRLARFKVPKRVELVKALPVSPAGKILKRELREAAIASDARDAS
ncbi:class I adenylate-forming enzyme family protein, partial [Corallococcus llansteffanensis]